MTAPPFRAREKRDPPSVGRSDVRNHRTAPPRRAAGGRGARRADVRGARAPRAGRARASTSTAASASASSACASSTSRRATSRSTTRTARSSSSSTARSTTTASCAPSSCGAGTASRTQATPRSSSTSTRSTAPTASRASTACSRSRSGTRAAGSCCSPATASARSRSSTRAGTASLSFASETGRPARGSRDPARGRPRGDRRLPRARLRAGAADRVPRRAQAAARPHARRARRPARLERYWTLDYAAKLDDVPVEELCERIRAGLLEATRMRLIADVPLGAFLSGGIDSSAVVAAMAAAVERAGPARSRSASTTSEFDELPHARRIAERFGTEHEEFAVRAAGGRDRCPSSSATTASRSRTRRRSRPSTSPR